MTKFKFNKNKKNYLNLLLGVFLTLCLVFLLFLGNEYLKLNRIFKENNSANAPELQTPHSNINILLLGVGGDEHKGAELTDTIVLVSIDPQKKKAALFSIPRDLWTKAEGLSPMKINSIQTSAKKKSLAKGIDEINSNEEGYRLLEKEIHKATGLPVHYHIRIDFKGFEKAIDVIGGLDIDVDESLTVSEKLWDIPTNDYYLLDVQVGRQHFDGKRALHYARSRFTSFHGDFSRNARQRRLLMSLKEKLVSFEIVSNPIILSKLLSTIENHLETNISFKKLLELYNIIKMLNNKDIISVSLTGAPNHYLIFATLNKNTSIVCPKAGIFDFSEVQAYINKCLLFTQD